MSDRAEIIRNLLGAWNDGDLQGIFELTTEDMEWHPLVVTALEGQDQAFRGRDGFREFFESWMATWETWNLHIEGFQEYGDNRILAFTRVHAKGRSSGVELDQEMGHLWELRDGLVHRGWSFLSREDAMASAERVAEPTESQ
jgi:ketosteroid isomerase-like protein